jgi:hypothetical protein
MQSSSVLQLAPYESALYTEVKGRLRLSLSCDYYFTSLFPRFRVSYTARTTRGGIYGLTIYPEGYRRQASSVYPSRQALTGQSPQTYEPVSSAHYFKLAAVVDMGGDGRSSTVNPHSPIS